MSAELKRVAGLFRKLYQSHRVTNHDRRTKHMELTFKLTINFGKTNDPADWPSAADLGDWIAEGMEDAGYPAAEVTVEGRKGDSASWLTGGSIEAVLELEDRDVRRDGPPEGFGV